MGEKPELEHRSRSDLKDRNVAVEVIPDGWSANRKLSGFDGGISPVKFGFSTAIGPSLLGR